MINIPSSLQLYLKNAGQMVRADTLLATAKKMESLKPWAQRQMAHLKKGPYRELLQTSAAYLEPVALDPFWVLLIFLGANGFEDIEFLPDSAARAYRAIRPKDSASGFESRRFVLEMGLFQGRH